MEDKGKKERCIRFIHLPKRAFMMTIPKLTEPSTFLKGCLQFYEEMLIEIDECKQEKRCEEERIQNCFEIAGNYKERINEAVRNFNFTNQEDEVFFFKKVKPLFTAEVEYYTYLYHIVLFKTKEMETDKHELEAFYKRQLLKREKLRKEFPAFYEYVQREQTYADAQWFTRHLNTRDCSLFDSLMGRYLAIEKFEEHLKAVMLKEL